MLSNEEKESLQHYILEQYQKESSSMNINPAWSSFVLMASILYKDGIVSPILHNIFQSRVDLGLTTNIGDDVDKNIETAIAISGLMSRLDLFKVTSSNLLESISGEEGMDYGSAKVVIDNKLIECMSL